MIVEADRRAVRPVLDSDAAPVTEIYAHYVRTSVATFDDVSPSSADWTDRISAHRASGLPFLIVTVDEEVAGYAYAQQWRPKPGYRHTLEDTIYLSPAHTGSGLGQLLLGKLIDACEAAGTRHIIAVIADTGEDASMALHRRAGFRTVGRLVGVGFKYDRWVDTTLMQLSLPASASPS